MAYTFDRVMKIGAASLAALTLFSGIRGCVVDKSDDRAIDVAMTDVIMSKGAGQHRITVNQITRTGFVREGHPLIERGGGAAPAMLNGPEDVCYVARFKVVGGVDNLPFLKWLGVSARDFNKVVHRNPANHGLQCVTRSDAPASPSTVTETPPQDVGGNGLRPAPAPTAGGLTGRISPGPGRVP